MGDRDVGAVTWTNSASSGTANDPTPFMSRFLVARKLPGEEVLTEIRAHATVNDHVKQLAEALLQDAVVKP
jgi:hypothetical protein